MDLHDALTQIAEIRRRAAAAGEFRGYRSLPVAASGVLAVFAAWLQPMFVPASDEPLRSFTLYWTVVASLPRLRPPCGFICSTGAMPIRRDGN